MNDTQDVQEASETLRSDTHKQETEKPATNPELPLVHRGDDKLRAPPTKQHSSVHFFPKATYSNATALPLSVSFSREITLSHYLSSTDISEITVSTIGPLTSKSTVSCLPEDRYFDESKEISCFLGPKKQTPSLDHTTSVIGEGEDYFLSLFNKPKKFISQSGHVQKIYKHFSTILEEVGQATSSSLGDVKIAEVNVKGLFVRLVNASLDKELEIGNHILQQNVNGQALSLYRFVPNVVMQAGSTVTVWAAASEAKHQPPSNFLWKEQNRFRTSPDCTTILCKPNGEAVAWYTPIHWKQAWEKLETDIEFDRRSVVAPTSRSHMFRWTTSETSVAEDKPDQPTKEISTLEVEQDQPVLKREKELPPTLFPNRSPWCNSPSIPAHPYCPLINPHDASTSGRSLSGMGKSRSTRPDPASRVPRDSDDSMQLPNYCYYKHRANRSREA
ncbi:lamin tail domain-containing protein 1 [Ochotona curzoniae]|uniref:lamin tail domain-containing protein 1 n=1 Tax=Ochotona curzoniae TaxID=130825 RepID=UPI001B349AF3|nr:lamin tail domain-containing protein 1 [Ochotona curzoniae]